MHAFPPGAGCPCAHPGGWPRPSQHQCCACVPMCVCGQHAASLCVYVCNPQIHATTPITPPPPARPSTRTASVRMATCAGAGGMHAGFLYPPPPHPLPPPKKSQTPKPPPTPQAFYQDVVDRMATLSQQIRSGGKQAYTTLPALMVTLQARRGRGRVLCAAYVRVSARAGGAELAGPAPAGAGPEAPWLACKCMRMRAMGIGVCSGSDVMQRYGPPAWHPLAGPRGAHDDAARPPAAGGGGGAAAGAGAHHQQQLRGFQRE